LVGIVVNSELLSWLITLCVFGVQCIVVVVMAAFDGNDFTGLRIQTWYLQWLIKPMLFPEYIDLDEPWTLFVFGLLNQSGLFYYAVIRPICSVLEARHRLYGVPSALRSNRGRQVAFGVIVLLFLNPGAMLDGIDLPSDLGLDWVVFGTSIWALGVAGDAIIDYNKFAGQFPSTPPIRRRPPRAPAPAYRMPVMPPQPMARHYQRSAPPPPVR
jgi:hypothetical protein